MLVGWSVYRGLFIYSEHGRFTAMKDEGEVGMLIVEGTNKSPFVDDSLK